MYGLIILIVFLRSVKAVSLQPGFLFHGCCNSTPDVENGNINIYDKKAFAENTFLVPLHISNDVQTVLAGGRFELYRYLGPDEQPQLLKASDDAAALALNGWQEENARARNNGQQQRLLVWDYEEGDLARIPAASLPSGGNFSTSSIFLTPESVDDDENLNFGTSPFLEHLRAQIARVGRERYVYVVWDPVAGAGSSADSAPRVLHRSNRRREMEKIYLQRVGPRAVYDRLSKSFAWRSAAAFQHTPLDALEQVQKLLDGDE